MCEQVYETSPGYFRKFAKYFRYSICDKYPNLPADNFALAFHNTKSNVCNVDNVKHWHLMIYSESPNNNGYTVPCPYACFALLISDGVNVKITGTIFDKLTTAVAYNQKYETEETAATVMRRKLPKMPTLLKKNRGVQTDMLSSNSLERYLEVLNGPYSGHLSQIIDAYISGYGSVDMQCHSMVTHFELSCSNAVCYCYECTEQSDN